MFHSSSIYLLSDVYFLNKAMLYSNIEDANCHSGLKSSENYISPPKNIHCATSAQPLIWFSKSACSVHIQDPSTKSLFNGL